MDRSEDVVLLISIGILVLLGLVCAGGINKWEYEECINVGHGKSYCAAQTLGCFDRRR